MDTEKLNSYFDSFIYRKITPCLSITVANREKIIYKFCKGKEIPENQHSQKLTPFIRLNIGSVTKIITSALLMKLVEDKLLKLNDSVKKYVPEFRFPEVQIKHLLTHTAGYLRKDELYLRRGESIESYLKRLYTDVDIKKTPGEYSDYWTNGYTMIMDIIQRVSGKSLKEFARKILFEPLGMKNTSYGTENLKRKDYILPYMGKRTLEELINLPVTGDTGVYTTGYDLCLFGRMILNNGVLNSHRIFLKKTIDIMFTEITGGKFNRSPVFWLKSKKDLHGCFGKLNSEKAGGHPGYSGCMLVIDPELNICIAILSNSPRLHSDWNNYKNIIDTLINNVYVN